MKTALCLVLLPAIALGSAVLRIDEDKELDVGLAMRTSVSGVAPQGANGHGQAGLDLAVLALTGQLERRLKVQVNGAAAVPGSLQLLDAYALVEPWDFLKLWVGHFLPPSDRATLTGPFFTAAWDPVFVAAYPAGFAGRDDGAALWGDLLGGRLHYAVGGFRGRNGAATSNPGFAPSWEARVAADVLDPEKGYYRNGTYFGNKRVLSFGATIHRQAFGAGTAAHSGAYLGYSFDAFTEQPTPVGVIDFEAALYRNEVGVPDAVLQTGWGAYGQLSWMLRAPTSLGRPEVWARFQWQHNEHLPVHSRSELGLGWIVDGPFIRAGVTVAHDEGPSSWSAKLGLQVVL